MERSGDHPMKADQVLIEDHKVLRGLLTQLQATADGQDARRRELLNALVSELGIHVRIELELFYPAVHEVAPHLAVAHAEHRAIDDQLAVVLRTDTTGRDFLTEVEMLAATLEHHANEEESTMFLQAQALGEAALEALGVRMSARQEHLRHSALAQLLRTVKREALRRA